MNQDFLTQIYFGNSVKNYLICIGILFGGLLLKGIFAKLLSWLSYRFFKKFSHQQYQIEFSNMLHKPFIHLVIMVLLYLAFYPLNFPHEWHFSPKDEFGIRWIILAVYKIVLIIFVARLFLRTVEFIELVYHDAFNETVSKDLVTFLKNLSKVLINIFAFFVILGEAFEINITALLASLGIGGLAIALAAQDTLANLIGSFIIYLDKPFNVGDLIEFGDTRGVVEKIGFRTTCIRTLDRSLLLVPNKKIIDSNLINITASTQRRVKFNLALTYGSKTKDILIITTQIKHAIASLKPRVADDITARFTDFDSSSLNLLVIFFVNSNEYDEMIEVKEMINIKIMDIVRNNGCDFAYPTQTIRLDNSSTE